MFANLLTFNFASFNSNMVRLKAYKGDRPKNFKHCFNSNMVRLKVTALVSNLLKSLCFNSNMVRLKGRLKTC